MPLPPNTTKPPPIFTMLRVIQVCFPWSVLPSCPPPGLGVSLQSLKCGCVQQVWVSRRGGMLLSLDASSRPGSAGRRDGEVVELRHHPPPQKRIQECASMLSPTRARGVPFGWLFLGYANLLYPAGVMGWLSNVCCPPLGLGVSLWSLKCVGLPPTPWVPSISPTSGY